MANVLFVMLIILTEYFLRLNWNILTGYYIGMYTDVYSTALLYIQAVPYFKYRLVTQFVCLFVYNHFESFMLFLLFGAQTAIVLLIYVSQFTRENMLCNV